VLEKFYAEIISVGLAGVAILSGALGFMIKRELRKRDEHKKVISSYETRFVKIDGQVAAVSHSFEKAISSVSSDLRLVSENMVRVEKSLGQIQKDFEAHTREDVKLAADIRIAQASHEAGLATLARLDKRLQGLDGKMDSLVNQLFESLKDR